MKFTRLLSVLVGSALPAFSAILDVENTNDSGAGSLRQAVADAQPNDSIRFNFSIRGQPIKLTGPEIVIDKNLSITGSFPGTVIDAGGNSRHFRINGGEVRLSTMRLINGAAPETAGGSIACFGTPEVLLRRMWFQDNSSGQDGGAVYYESSDVLTIIDCEFTRNRARVGGAISAADGTLSISQSSIHHNSATFGGALRLLRPTTVEYTTLAFNRASLSYGVGQNFAPTTFENCTIIGNRAEDTGGGISNSSFSSLTVRNSVVVSNFAGDEESNIGGVFTGENNFTEGDPHLQPLGFYGGNNPSMPPRRNSPVIDAGMDTFQTLDQRSAPAKIDGLSDGNVIKDIGACEAQTAIVVTNLNDSGVGSLREALRRRLPNLSGRRIYFDPSLSGQVITLGGTRLLTDGAIKPTTIDGSDLSAPIIIDANFQSGALRNGANLLIDNITFRGAGERESLFSHFALFNRAIVRNCRFEGSSGETAWPVFSNVGSMVAERITISGNATSRPGAAIENSSDLVLKDSTIFGNSTEREGGAIACEAGSRTHLIQCTVTGNHATGGGGAFWMEADSDSAIPTELIIEQCTIVDNSTEESGGGIKQDSGTTLTLNNTILTLNQAAIAPQNVGVGFSGEHNILGGDPYLSPLGDYGGPTLTMPPRPGSPAIDNGGDTAEEFDQRGFARILDGNANDQAFPDIGAVEFVNEANLNLAQIWTSDTDGDGMPFGLEQALGTDPFTPGTNPIEMSMIDQTPSLLFPVNPFPAPRTRWKITRSVDLKNFSEIVYPESPNPPPSPFFGPKVSHNQKSFWRLEILLAE